MKEHIALQKQNTAPTPEIIPDAPEEIPTLPEEIPGDPIKEPEHPCPSPGEVPPSKPPENPNPEKIIPPIKSNFAFYYYFMHQRFYNLDIEFPNIAN